MFARVAAEPSPALAYAAPPCVDSPAHSSRTIAAAEGLEALHCSRPDAPTRQKAGARPGDVLHAYTVDHTALEGALSRSASVVVLEVNPARILSFVEAFHAL